jgi:hypothetical protein
VLWKIMCLFTLHLWCANGKMQHTVMRWNSCWVHFSFLWLKLGEWKLLEFYHYKNK